MGKYEKNKFKIGINASFTHDRPTGLGVYTYEVTKELLKIAPEVVVYTSSCNLKRKYPNNVHLISSLTSPQKRFKGHLTRIVWTQSWLPFYYFLDRLSLLYTPVPEGILCPYFNQIVTVHDIIPFLYPKIHPKMKYYYRFVLPWLLKFAKAIICVSENTKKDIINAYSLKGNNIYVIYEGCKLKELSIKKNEIIKKRYNIKKYILYVGDMRPYKNLERTLEAFSRIQIKDLYFVIGGKKDPRFYPEIEKKAKSLSLCDRVIFTDYIKEEELSLFYKEADLFIFPSLYEGFGLPPLEAMACGCPVVVSNAASLPEVCGDAAYYVNPYSVDSIAEGIYKVLTDEDLRQSLIQKGLERVKLFSWEKTAEQTLEVFEKVLDENCFNS